MEYKLLDKETFQKYKVEFSELYQMCFNVSMSPEEVEWRFLQNPEDDLQMYVAIDQGRLVANYSVSPICLYKDGKIIKAAQSLNTMTHPGYIGKGIFVDLASRLYAHLKDEGYKMVMGFPNNISNRTFVSKLGWRDISVIPTLEINLNTTKEKAVIISKPVIEDFDFELDYTDCMNRTEKTVSVYKTQEYLKWRYLKHPTTQYYNFVLLSKNNKVSSRIILKFYRNRLNIVDSCFSSEEEQKILMNYAIQFGRKHGKDLMTLWAKLGSREHLIIESYGAVLASPITYFGGLVFDSEENMELYHGHDWCLNMSDDNVY